MSEVKKCKGCGFELPLDRYMSKKDGEKYYLMGKCKSCYSIQRKPSAAKTRAKKIPSDPLERRKYYQGIYQKYKDTYKALYEKVKKTEEWQMWHSNRMKNYYNKNKGKYRKNARAWYAKEEVKKRCRDKFKERMKTDQQFAMQNRLRYRLRHVIDAVGDKKYKYASAPKLVGCDIATLEKHIESLFTEGMTWELFMNGEIHIDHIKPCVLFNLTDFQQQKECFHYTNLQPLWKKDNMSKNATYNGVNYAIKNRMEKYKKSKQPPQLYSHANS